MNGNSGTRRHFCSTVAFSAIAGSLSPSFASSEKEHAADVVIIGGGLGGCAAAIGALRNGLTVVMTEATDWIGGQLTSQGVPPDEHRWRLKRPARIGLTASCDLASGNTIASTTRSPMQMCP